MYSRLSMAVVFILVLAGAASAASWTGPVPTIPVDGNGNPLPVIVDLAGEGLLLDSGATTTVVSITDTVTVHIGDTTTTVNSGDSAILVVLDDTAITINSGDSAILVAGSVDVSDTTLTVNSGDSALLVSGRLDSITDTVTVSSGGSPLSVDSIEDTFGANASIVGGTLGDISDSIGASVEVVNRVTVTLPETATVRQAPYTENTGGTAVFSESVVVPVAINLGSEYNLWEITSDTDCVISTDSATLTPLNGDIVQNYAPFVYPGRLQTIYAVTRTGLIDATAVIRARGWR